ncbi:MAG: methionyl-tRNA formyltransferase [Candidatus Nanopelagicales bacterium]
MRLVFAGTPAAAVPSLRALVDSPHNVVAVVTRPDAPKGRGRGLSRSDVGVLADELGLPVLTPPHPRDDDFIAALSELAPDCVPVVAYGALVPTEVLAIPRLGWVNLHFSLLPAWRGAAPVQRAIIAGDSLTGATTFVLDQGMDTGPVLGTLTEPIGPRDTAGDLLGRLSDAGAELLRATMDGLALAKLTAVAQPADGVSLAPKITVADAHVEWASPAMHIDRLIRGCTPAPGAWSELAGDRLKLGPVRPLAAPAAADVQLEPGRVRVEKRRVLVGTLTEPVELGDVAAPGRRAMPAPDWARGARLTGDEVFV